MPKKLAASTTTAMFASPLARSPIQIAIRVITQKIELKLICKCLIGWPIVARWSPTENVIAITKASLAYASGYEDTKRTRQLIDISVRIFVCQSCGFSEMSLSSS